MRLLAKIMIQKGPSHENDDFPKYLINKYQPYSEKIDLESNQIYIFTDIPEFNELLEELKGKRLRVTKWFEKIYSEEEFLSAELLHFWPTSSIGYPQPEEGFEEITFDINTKCLNCGNGLIQINPIRTLKPKMGKKMISGIYWIDEIVVTLELKELMIQEGLTGVDFWPVIDHRKGNFREDVSQLKITSILPPLMPEAIAKSPTIKICDCGKKGFMLEDSAIYSRSVLNYAMDFNLTQEWLGGMNQTLPLKIVSNSVYRFFKDRKIKGVGFEPVRLI